ncbi:hypothetical protein JCM19239_2639 [Vibrio variabilis]|uniref:Uncharacterized protein n=1 Tax=Vibrio variabilis TaxID=990271 RepID=A0ABQ0JNC4_9VIBR|nr:hypothetical protein JCM19239_2639 [Vibrio variabilis]
MAAPASRQAITSSIIDCCAIGILGWSSRVLRAPLGATMMAVWDG